MNIAMTICCPVLVAERQLPQLNTHAGVATERSLMFMQGHNAVGLPLMSHTLCGAR